MKRGVVVFTKAPRLKEGTPVRVEPIKPRKPARSGPKVQMLRPVGKWQGKAGELQSLLDEVQRLRDADLELERGAWK